MATDIYLYAGEANPADIRLRDPTVAAGGGGFPTQFSGLRTYYSAAMRELCLVATADAPAGMGAVPRLRKGGVTYAVYLVETGDANASHVYLRTSAGTKAIRLKT